MMYVYIHAGTARADRYIPSVGTLCNDVVPLHALAHGHGDHGKSSQCSGGRAGARLSSHGQVFFLRASKRGVFNWRMDTGEYW
jgi:hypothetical protein